MGIKGLLGLLRGYTSSKHIKEFRGSTLGLDGSCFLYKGASLCAVELGLNNLPTTEYINKTLEVIAMLQMHDIKPVVVLDGYKLPAKQGVNESRKRERNESLITAKRLWDSGDREEAVGYFKRAVRVTNEMTQCLIEALRTRCVDYIVAPFEADAQLAYLENKEIITGVITEDSDLLVFGYKEVMYKLDLNGQCRVIRREDLNKALKITNYTFELFRYICILIGCDHLKHIDRIGIKRAHLFIQKFAKSHISIEQAIQQMGQMFDVSGITMPDDYFQKFTMANETFLHQCVFDPETRAAVMLQPPEPTGELYHKNVYILHAENILDICLGNINTETQQKVNSYTLDSLKGPGSMWGAVNNEENTLLQDEDVTSYISTGHHPENSTPISTRSCQNVKVIEIGKEFLWTVPSFPVLQIKFNEVSIELDGKLCDGVIKAEDAQNLDHLPVDIMCLSTCRIKSSKEYYVIWTWESYTQLSSEFDESDASSSYSDISVISETDVSSEESVNDEDIDSTITHRLPFKVLGVAHSKENQLHLENAFVQKYEKKELVTAHLVPEPDNEKDAQAISVQINYGKGQVSIGYIPRELTEYIHPLLENSLIAQVEIDNTAFRTRHCKMGFYMKLLITRYGEWEPFVVAKARSVR